MSPTPSLVATLSGAAMDRALPPRRRWHRMAWLLLPAAGLSLLLQRPAQVPTLPSAQLAAVRAGEFRDELPLRARVEPLRSVQLDAPEAGRVEAVLAHEGDWVEAGAPLYRLHSPDQEQLLMQRGAEVAQQMANVSAQRSAQVASLAQGRRELVQLQAAQAQAEAEWRRQAELAAAGFVSPAVLDQARRQHELATRLLAQAQQDQRLEADTRQQSLAEMARAVQGLQRGLQLLERSHERLLQRAPIAGRLSGFQLQLGASVRAGDRLGRLDDPASGVHLVADVDEHYLPRIQPGQAATANGHGALTLHQALPQVQGGKLRVLLRWPEGEMPGTLRPGQAVDLKLQFSAPAPALLLPDGPGVQERLYVRNGVEVHARQVRLGRRAAGQVEVLSGLRAGDEVLISQPPTEAERFALP